MGKLRVKPKRAVRKKSTSRVKKAKSSIGKVTEVASSLGSRIAQTISPSGRSRAAGRKSSKMTPERLAKKILVERLKKKLYKKSQNGN